MAEPRTRTRCLDSLFWECSTSLPYLSIFSLLCLFDIIFVVIIHPYNTNWTFDRGMFLGMGNCWVELTHTCTEWNEGYLSFSPGCDLEGRDCVCSPLSAHIPHICSMKLYAECTQPQEISPPVPMQWILLSVLISVPLSPTRSLLSSTHFGLTILLVSLTLILVSLLEITFYVIYA